VSDAARLVFARELRGGRRSFLSWAVPVGGLVALFCALQPSMVASGLLAAKLAGLPASMRHALGLELVDFARPPVYLAASFLYVTLPCALYAGLAGAGTIAKEELAHTAELLYAQPASRARILAGKAAAVAVQAVALPCLLGAIAAGVLGAVAAAPLEGAVIAQMFGGVVALALAFGGIGMLIAALVRDARAASGAALGVVLGTYFLGMLSALSDAAAPLRFLSPYKLVEPSAIVADGLAPLGVLALVAIGAAAVALAIARYRRKDLLA
jgi:ABC-type transport system involved in multi-copper enzyme maturation permease subunit